MERISIFSENFQSILGTTYHKAALDNSSLKEISTIEQNTWCSYCRVELPDLETQRFHYKSDLHRYNLKQSLLKSQLSSKEAPQEIIRNGMNIPDYSSSISGLDSEKEEDSFIVPKDKYFLQAEDEKVYCINKCILQKKKKEILEEPQMKSRLKNCCLRSSKWAILLVGGGYFAGAIFSNGEVLRSKTYHYYTVRAGQGGTQSSRDNKSGGSQPKSAGASLRRHNEQALAQKIEALLAEWADDLKTSSLVFYTATVPNRHFLFGPSPLLDRSGEVIRDIPFTTRKPSLEEAKRVYALLSTVEVYASLEKVREAFMKPNPTKIDSKMNETQEVLEKPLPTEVSSTEDSEEDLDERLEVLAITENTNRLSVNTMTEEQRLQLEQKKLLVKKEKEAKKQELAKKKEIIDVLNCGDLDKLKKLVEQLDEEDFVNRILDENKNTLLHVAALSERAEVLRFLLDKNADPCRRNSSNHTPYTCTQSKIIRDTFVTFARENPEKFNYNKAHIPLTSLTDEERAEKKKRLKKIKSAKEKEKKAENTEKERFLQLSDREKRALAAERRILNSNGTVKTRCFKCGTDITGKVPFEYGVNLFCSMDCLKVHRLQNLPKF